MKTLELKDICGYLPYGLRHIQNGAIDLMFPVYTDSWVGSVKLILRPMSDLTKEIIHKGETFIPIDDLKNICRFMEYDTAGLLYTTGGCLDSDWRMVFDKLHEWMFDYRGLIDSGLAIDVNTLPENPYE